MTQKTGELAANAANFGAPCRRTTRALTTVLAILTYAAAISVVAGIIPLMSAYVPGAYPPEIQSFACVVMVLFAICGQRSVTHVRNAGAFGARIALNLDGEKSALQILQPATNRCLAA